MGNQLKTLQRKSKERKVNMKTVQTFMSMAVMAATLSESVLSSPLPDNRLRDSGNIHELLDNFFVDRMVLSDEGRCCNVINATALELSIVLDGREWYDRSTGC